RAHIGDGDHMRRVDGKPFLVCRLGLLPRLGEELARPPLRAARIEGPAALEPVPNARSRPGAGELSLDLVQQRVGLVETPAQRVGARDLRQELKARISSGRA